MKATLEFDLPEDQEQFRVASMATDLWLALWTISGEIRANGKNNRGYVVDEQQFREILDEYSITLEELS